MEKVSGQLRTVVPSHKISSPQAHRYAVERSHLLQRILGDDGARVVVFQAPAGYGKTSLMVQVLDGCKARKVTTGWISLDESDNDLTRLLGHVHELMASLGERGLVSGITEPYDRDPSTHTRTDWLVNEFAEFGRPLAIFFDDLHFISSRSVLSFLRDLLANAPDNVRFFLASRAVPEIGLSRLVVGNQALVLRADELRFSEQEVAQFLKNSVGPILGDADVTAIHIRTEGWPAAVHLYRLTLANPSVRTTLNAMRVHQLPELASYLADNVLMMQDRDVQDFLLKTSILERMSGPLCDALLDRSDSTAMLTRLERVGLFVRRTESEERWFTYHALFSHFLRDHLRETDAAKVRVLHRNAAVWLREQGHFEEALHHFSAAADHADAADVFETWAERILPDGHLITVDRWSDCIPMAELEKRPGLVVKIVWALAFLSRHHKLEPLLKLFHEIPSSNSTGDPSVAGCIVSILKDDLASIPLYLNGLATEVHGASRFRTFELAAVCNGRGYHAMAAGRYAEALKYLAQGRSLSEAAGSTFALAYAIGKTALTLVSQGQLREALLQFQVALVDPRMKSDDSLSTSCLACGYIMALYEANDLDQALTLFEQFREIINDAGVHDYIVIAYRAVSRIHDLRGNTTQSLLMLEEAEKILYHGHWPRAVRLISWERVRREVVAGRLDRAKVIADRIDGEIESADRDWIRVSEDLEDSVIGTARLRLHDGEAKEALRLLRPSIRKASLQTRRHRQIKLLTLAALGLHKLGDSAQAHRSLEEALSLAAPDGYVRAILDEGEEITQLLLDHLQVRLENPASTSEAASEQFLATLIGTVSPEALPKSDTRPSTDTQVIAKGPDGFSEREKRVMAMLVDCMSNDQIAANMFVTRETVRYHLKNIYGKLGVRGRLEAIRRIRGGLGAP